MGKKRVLVAMSGGVDSSVTAALLVEAGYECVGVTMQLFSQKTPVNSGDKSCCSISAVEDARRVAETLNIPFYVLNMVDIFEKKVIEPFVNEYMAGRTPNPCVVCNDDLKFGVLLKKAKEVDADYVSTGHYVRIFYDNNLKRFVIKRGVDKNKDQSYFLYGLTQDQLRHTLTPLGNLTKKETRALARRFKLITKDKKESQEVCFVDGKDSSALFNIYASSRIKPGPIVTVDGEIIGEHKGLVHYTVGQRRGLGIATGKPIYVIALDAEKNKVIVGDEKELYGKELIANEVNWVSVPSLEETKNVRGQIRYRAPAVEADISPYNSENRVKTVFTKPQRAITPGQRVVWYLGDLLLGGGVIQKQLD